MSELYADLDGVVITECLERRFWSKVEKTDGCWNWVASKVPKGYGQFGLNVSGVARKVRSHRFAYLLTYGLVPQNMCVLHRCDNPACCNPEHLFLGTVRDNNVDMVLKGRQVVRRLHGERSTSSILTTADVMAIYALHSKGLSQQNISEIFDVTISAVNVIITGKNWKGITPERVNACVDFCEGIETGELQHRGLQVLLGKPAPRTARERDTTISGQ